MFPTVNLVINLSSVAVLWLGATGSQSGQLQVGSLVAYLSYLIQILMSVVMATFMISMIPRASVSAGRIQEVLDTESTVRTPADPIRITPTRGAVEFRGVGFHYPGADHPVLTDISFTTRAGQTTAIVGSTGAGKTTLLQLIPRLFDVTAGTVLRRRGRRARARHDGAVERHRPGAAAALPVLGDGGLQPAPTASPTPPRARCGRRSRSPRPPTSCGACRAALEARIDQGGTNVSGGQRQRLAIARALVAPAGDLPVRRLLLRPRPGHRRPAARRAQALHRQQRRAHRRPAGLDHHLRRLTSWSSRTASWSARAPTPSCGVTCPTYAEIVAVAARRSGRSA